ncbi:MAG: 4-hydroxy-3-methylbut-2-enyl diphosphate reductase [Treponema sp.]|nr:4-hydroxy-3-methylbut-2-enyl diphosphate reductase [Treponema sp.]
MKIIRSRLLGFCFGVRRAVELAVQEAKKAHTSQSLQSGEKTVYTLGSLIHNPKVLSDLELLGVKTINNDDNEELTINNKQLSDCSVIIRAHGISPELEKNLKDSGCKIIDATCPKVKANQLKIKELSELGYCLFVAGEKKHAEITGLLGYAKGANCGANCGAICGVQFCVVIGTEQEAKENALTLSETNKKNSKVAKVAKAALLGQTTISADEYRLIGNQIKSFFPNLEIVNTICSATHQRQEALREILPKVDAVIVAGGEQSANTRRLFVIAKESGKPCVIAENAEAIPKEFFAYETIGLCSGASTPDSVIDEIEKFLLQ